MFGTLVSVNGLTAAVVGILLATTSRLGQSNIQVPIMWSIVLVACTMGAVLGISAAMIMVTQAASGGLLSPSSTAQKQHRKEGRP